MSHSTRNRSWYFFALSTGLCLACALSLVPLIIVVPTVARAAGGNEDIEGLFGNEGDSAASTPSTSPSAPDDQSDVAPPPESPQPAQQPQQAEQAKPKVDLKKVTDLGKLETFSDVVVIQRRYLPKTGRFEVFGGLSLILNDAFFNNFGLNGRFGYYFRERYGVEAVAWALTGTERQVTSDLHDKLRVNTSAFISPKYYFGADFKWAPVYGKMTWRNRKITPFDMYFSFGGGMLGTNQGSSVATLHLGTGQIFARSKSMAYRWDLSWNMFSAKSNIDPNAQSALYHNIFLTVGASLFYPEATYR